MGPTDSLPKERAGCPQVRSADFLEHEGHVGRSRSNSGRLVLRSPNGRSHCAEWKSNALARPLMTGPGHQRPVDTPSEVAPCPLRPQKRTCANSPRYVCFVPIVLQKYFWHLVAKH